MKDMDPTTQGQVRALISEFRRLASYEKETRRKSNQLPIPEVIREWEASVENLKRAVCQVNEFYHRVLEQRSQVASLGEVRSPDGAQVLKHASSLVLRRWLSQACPYLEDFVVLRRGDSFEQRDRADFCGSSVSLLGCPACVIVKEPLLYLEHEMVSSFSEFDDAAIDIFSTLEHAVKAPEVKQSKLILSLSQAEESELWRKFEEAEPAVLELHDVSRSQESLAARLALAQ